MGTSFLDKLPCPGSRLLESHLGSMRRHYIACSQRGQGIAVPCGRSAGRFASSLSLVMSDVLLSVSAELSRLPLYHHSGRLVENRQER